ncbi:MAG: 2-oxoacid:acceptor oxidoreductase subunit alpha [Candidatus Cloacimonetes bacterium]|nr:2-oxoacid:acceptor oxidoreductase subunit alpha [Candidatus Cloacimonadota bacterium]
MAKKSDLVIRVSGESGEGVISTGDLITLSSSRAGLEVYTFSTFPAEIKGGNAMFEVRLSRDKLFAQGDKVDVFLAFNQEAYDMYIKDLNPENGVLIYDSDAYTPPTVEGRIDYAIPLTSLAKEEVGALITKNIVTIGCLVGLFDLPYDSIKDLIIEKFTRKGEKVVENNLKALDIGRQYCSEKIKKQDPYSIDEGSKTEKCIVVTGCDAIGMGAIVAGCKAYYGYPITPATDVFKFLAKELPKAGGVIMQMEDEIAALAGCVGASYGGVKTLTATSGPGVSLMNEVLGYSSMAELPIVLVDVMRGGPSTGLPTKTEQSDLNCAIHGSHGEGPKIVISAATVDECFYHTIDAFNYAEEYQLPVILLTDGFTGGRKEAFPIPDLEKIKIVDRLRYQNVEDEDYHRYEDTESGISPISFPGDKGGRYTATGLEHTVKAKPAYDPDNRYVMMNKRFRKLQTFLKNVECCKVSGDKDAQIAILAWGSTAGACYEAIERLQNDGKKVKLIVPKILYPFPEEEIGKALEGVTKVVIPELNFTGQFAQLVKAAFSNKVEVVQYNEYLGLPFKPHQIVDKFMEVSQ